MDDSSMNKTIHEFLGKCWHERVRTVHGFGTNLCSKCGDREIITDASYGEQATTNWRYPSYTTDLNAMREVEGKLFDKGLAMIYINNLMEKVRADYCTDIRTDWYDWFKIATAPAKLRAAAVVDIIDKEG